MKYRTVWTSRRAAARWGLLLHGRAADVSGRRASTNVTEAGAGAGCGLKYETSGAGHFAQNTYAKFYAKLTSVRPRR